MTGGATTALSVLVVDDEPLLLMIATEAMRDAGYAVFEASDGQAAISVLKNNPGIDLLVSDIKMPRLNGFQLAEMTLTHWPKTKILLMTGYAQEVVPQRIKAARVPIIYKPFDIDRLAGLAKELLGA